VDQAIRPAAVVVHDPSTLHGSHELLRAEEQNLLRLCLDNFASTASVLQLLHAPLHHNTVVLVGSFGIGHCCQCLVK